MFHRVSTTPVDGLDDGPGEVEYARLQFNGYSGNYYTARTVVETLRLELMGLRGTIDGTCRILGVSYEMSLDLYDDDLRDAETDSEGVHHAVSDFTVAYAASAF
jgi:hypothetical protein